MNVKSIVIGVIVLALVFGAGYWFGSRPDDNGGTIDNLRSELRGAKDANRVLQADNQRLRETNSRLGKELEDAQREAAESYRIAEALSANNSQTGRNLEAAGKIVDRLREVSGQIRKGNPAAQATK